MNINDTPHLREKVIAFKEAADDLLGAVTPLQDRGVCPIDTMQLAYIVAGAQTAADVLDAGDR